MRRAATASLSLALALSIAAMAPLLGHSGVAAASCVKFVASNFDAPGNDHFNENGEWVRIKNVCASRRSLNGWRIHDYHQNHTYTFSAGTSIAGGKSITLFTGKGTNTSWKRYWKMNAAVWNNTGIEYAYLRKADGTLMSRWAED